MPAGCGPNIISAAPSTAAVPVRRGCRRGVHILVQQRKATRGGRPYTTYLHVSMIYLPDDHSVSMICLSRSLACLMVGLSAGQRSTSSTLLGTTPGATLVGQPACLSALLVARPMYIPAATWVVPIITAC